MVLRDAAGSDDREFVFEVRNDPTTIQYSYSKRPVGWEEHKAWWLKVNDLIFIAEGEDQQKLGVVRLSEVDAQTAEIHVMLHPKARRQGRAVVLLALGREEARKLGYTRVLARVDAPNTASLRAFLKEGYRVTSPGVLLLERDI